MNRLICIPVLLLAPLAGYGQDIPAEPTTHRLGVGAGVSRYLTRDEVYSPMLYSGVGMPLSAGYTSTGHRRIYSIELGFTTAQLASSITTNTSEGRVHYEPVVNAVCAFSYLRRVTGRPRWTLYVGGSERNFFLYKNHYTTANDSQFGLDIFASLDVDASLRRRLRGADALSFEVSYPVLSYVVGRMYAPAQPPERLLKYDELTVGNVLKSGDFLTVNTFTDVTFRVSYYRQLSRRLGIEPSYRFQYYQYPKLFTVKSALHSVTVTLSFGI